MKLKKIASLALAGVMAVSMLAGCAGNTNTDNNGEGQGEVETTVTMSDVLNQAQSADNKAKVTFSENDTLKAALQTAIVQDGVSVSAKNFTDAAKMVGINETADGLYGTFQFKAASNEDVAGLLNGDTYYYWNNPTGTNGSKLAGEYTTVGYKTYAKYPSAEAALKAIAKDMDTTIAKLPATSKLEGATSGQKLVKGEKYYTFSYTGNAVLIVLGQKDGTTTYGVFYVINQTATETTYNG